MSAPGLFKLWLRRTMERLLWPVLLLHFSGCALLQAHTDIQAFSNTTVLVGRVQDLSDATGPVVVAALRSGPGSDGRIDLTHAALLNGPGAYELVVPPGWYRLVAFRDANANLTLDPGEACGEHRASAQTAAPAAWPVFDIELTGQAGSCGLPSGTRFVPPGAHALHSTQVGTVASLDDERYSSQRGREGYWAPLDFLRRVGGNVVFIEPYDPARIPVLFVHGAAGSPQDWRYFIANLDRKRYQPWVFHYPSGASLDLCAELLHWKLGNLQQELQLQTLAIAAHSMGGLVVRRMLLSPGGPLPFVKLFVSLSTPWGGDDRAEAGTRLSPTVIPSWKDLVPAGGFLSALFASPLPAGLQHHLLFSHRGRSPRVRTNNDGTVTLASQLSSPAQAEASSVRGFDEDHDSILNSPQVWQHLQALLDRLQVHTTASLAAH